MKCSQCGMENIVQAKFCRGCGHAFSSEEQEVAYQKTIFGKLDAIEAWWNRLSLKVVTEHMLFRILVIVGILGYGVYMFYQNGAQLRILESDAYRIQYNEDSKEYYLLTEMDEVALNMYIPFQADIIMIEQVKDGVVLDQQKYLDVEDIRLQSQLDCGYRLVAWCDSQSVELFLYVICGE